MPDMPTSGPQIERGHEMPFAQQFSIFLPNRVGRLNELLEILDSAQGEFVTMLSGRGGLLVVDRGDAEAASSDLLARYQITADRSESLASPAKNAALR